MTVEICVDPQIGSLADGQPRRVGARAPAGRCSPLMQRPLRVDPPDVDIRRTVEPAARVWAGIRDVRWDSHRKSGSQWTRCWRERDSNPRSPAVVGSEAGPQRLGKTGVCKRKGG